MSVVFDSLLRPAINAAADSHAIKSFSQHNSLTSKVVDRFVAGSDRATLLPVLTRELAGGLSVTVDYLGEDTVDEQAAADTVREYLALITAMSEVGATGIGRLEVSLKLTAVGLALPEHGRKIATEHARTICAAAHHAGVLVTLDAEGSGTVDDRLDILRELQSDYPDVGTVLQAYLRRTEEDCRTLIDARVRLCKGAYAEPVSVAFSKSASVDNSYQRCLRILMRGNGYPMIATHDPMMIAAARALAKEAGRSSASWEYQMLYGIRADEQRRLVESGSRVRVYLPYGQEWYGYFLRRLSERPANLTFFARSLVRR
ncbi:putative proline dehydrogenase [Gordonia effusa NBRC 100432]|uniref:proline dehydrogenase n=1 Tax=Gordonia effusa NBRC 100432 TaxID=1077974 RepID=H0QYC0_9ACTN|nr:proline dehydrogenase family protein [Gordonia effusa]GAB17821.1 putative proline dehydrogenase [Gordonia effusa NBRC 100432]